MTHAEVDAAVAALRAGDLAILPTDTVYGLASSPDEEPVRRLYRAKGRAEPQPTALVAAGVEQLLELVPELDERVLRALLPGPYTLVLPNPAGRYAWLNGRNPETIGVRVPALRAPARDVLDRVGAVAATSANLPGGRDPRTLAQVPAELRAAAAAAVDGGELPGEPSTVLDLSGPEPRILRAGAVAAEAALEQVAAALSVRPRE